MTPDSFDVTGPLPGAGVHLLEASAGTGKTYTIAALAARYLAEGLPLSRLLMVTFTRAATQELRDRIRARLAQSEQTLRQAVGGSAPAGDRIDRLLSEGDAETIELRLGRITTALADLDAATIATTHEFCGRMLDGVGILAGVDPTVVHVDDVSELAREVAADFWLRAFAHTDRPDFSWAEAQAIAERVARFDGPLAPDPVVLPGYARQIRFAEAVRRELSRRKAARGIVTHDDAVIALRDLLQGRRTPEAAQDPALAAAVRSRLRQRYRVVLVDEFQDTDPDQWAILHDAFAGPVTCPDEAREQPTLVLIGDPKQAVYSFRGAEVNAYLAAAGLPGVRHHTLAVNWRSDSPLVEALDGLLRGAQLGDPRIEVRPVSARHDRARLRVAGDDLQAPVRLRVLAPPAGPRHRRPGLSELRDHIRADVVGDIARLLAAGAMLTLAGDDTPARALTPRDIAVLVRSNRAAERIRAALAEAGIPAVHPGATSVFDTAEAHDWLTLLRACESPRSDSIRAATLTSFVGWTFPRLVTATDQDLAEVSAMLRSWARTLRQHGVGALVAAVAAAGLAERLLATAGGERRLTDLRHLGELLIAAQARQRLGPTALLDWLGEHIRRSDADAEERTRRMDSDADAVQVMTVHRAKGLEFPVVYLPDQWESTGTWDDRGPFFFHREGVRHLYLAPPCRDRREARALHDAEAAAESLRLLYVAATRAQCRIVAWWAGHESRTPTAPLHRILFRAGSAQPRPAYPARTSPADILAAPGVLVQPAGTVFPPVSVAGDDDAPMPQARRFTRVLDDEWRRTSYSGLTAAAHEPAAGAAESRLPVLEDEIETDGALDSIDALTGPLAALSPMADLPRGPAFGTLVHAIYETFDPHASDLAAEVREHAARWLSRLPSAEGQILSAGALAEALLPAMRTPLGRVAGGLRLCDIAASDRLTELDFEYALAGGPHPRGRLRLTDVADVIDAHLQPGDPLHGYGAQLRDPRLGDEVLRGYLTGSIDAVLRVPAADGHRRHVVVDYKTNWLGPLDRDVPLRLGHYTPPAMAAAMREAHYPLQALVYAVALHRFLRWRLPGYVPDRDLGGVAYLFVRGMAGPDTPVVDGMPCGVFTWYPPPALVTGLSDLLAHGVALAGVRR